jgi:hypothetical protein
LVRQHTDALEASLQQTYRIDLRDLWRGGLTWRRLRVLVRHLPLTCPLAVELGGADWSRTDFLLADLFSVWTEKPHPADPRRTKIRGGDDERLVRSAYRESRSRRERLGITGSVLRSG